MLILWIRKKKTVEPNSTRQNEKESFQKHDAAMKQFRLDHPDAGIIGAGDFITPDGNILAPVHNVKLTAHIQN